MNMYRWKAFCSTGRAPGEVVPVVMTVHDTEEIAMKRAVERIKKMDSMVKSLHLIRIEDF